MTIEDLKEKDLFLYQYIRGSWCHGIGIEGKSDIDMGGVFLAPMEKILGLRSEYDDIEQISDEKSDETYYELGRWIELLLKSNPTALESLFIDKEFIVGNISPLIKEYFLDNREMFLSKECFQPILGYSYSQIAKCQGYNKKCNYPENMERKTILDFCYTFNKQGSIPIKKWLKDNNYSQEELGLVNIPNMHEMYAVFRDRYGEKGYRGIVNKEENSNEIRLSSVEKDELPICHMQFSKDAYQAHCKIYKEWQEWKQKRNPIRYIDNKGYNYDAKNVCECVRLIHMGIELAKGDGFNVKRTWDRDFLLDIKNHKFSYEEIMSYVTDKRKEFDELVKKSTLPETIDKEKINQMLINFRKEIYFID